MAEDSAASTSNETDQALSRNSRSLRKYLLPSNWPPWAAYVPYRAYETALRNSRYMRKRWDERPLGAQHNKNRSIPQTFHYEPLSSPDYIRLLHIRPGQEAEPLSCYVVADYDLSCSPTYWAISYSWIDGGGESGFVTVKCDDQELTVQTTIYQLLKRLREPDRTITLWIDAICINQADTSERNSQVQMMGRIYSLAEQVIAWVGEEDQNIQGLADFLERVQEMTRLEDDNLNELPQDESRLWSNLVSFLSRPFFTRTWVLQEVCLARRCELRCGSHVWEWSSLQRVLQYLLGILDAYSTNVFEIKIFEILCGGVFDFWDNWADPSPDLLDLLLSSRGTFTSQPADKVYALLSLSKDTSQVKVDYRKHPREIFIDVASRFAVDFPGLLLHLASDNIWNNVRSLPSWVPDWTRPVFGGITYAGPWESRSSILAAIKNEKGASSAKVEERLLIIEMLEIDEVRIVGLPWPGDQLVEKGATLIPHVLDLGYKKLARLEEWHHMLDQLEENAGNTYGPTGEPRTAAFMRTLVVGAVNETELDEPYSSWDKVFAKLKDRLRHLRDQSLGNFGDNPADRS